MLRVMIKALTIRYQLSVHNIHVGSSNEELTNAVMYLLMHLHVSTGW